MMKRIVVTGLVVAACGLAGAGGLAGVGTAAAEEVRQQLNAPMILNSWPARWNLPRPRSTKS